MSEEDAMRVPVGVAEKVRLLVMDTDLEAVGGRVTLVTVADSWFETLCEFVEVMETV